jgi:hypothetical protein
MGKIYYSVEAKRSGGFQVNFLDMLGQRLLWGEPYPTMRIAMKTFAGEHREAKFLEWHTFIKRLGLIEAEREKMAAWNGWAK